MKTNTMWDDQVSIASSERSSSSHERNLVGVSSVFLSIRVVLRDIDVRCSRCTVLVRTSLVFSLMTIIPWAGAYAKAGSKCFEVSQNNLLMGDIHSIRRNARLPAERKPTFSRARIFPINSSPRTQSGRHCYTVGHTCQIHL